jgi:predicted transposase/invertase (TIGR01784 family)
MNFADPKNDIAFKKIFGDKNHKKILISFLNAVLGFKGKNKIAEVTVVNPYQVPKIEDLKETVLDIQAVTKKGERFIVEMQKKDLKDFPQRSLYYTSKAYVEQLKKGVKFKELQKVYFIGICSFSMFNNKRYISRHLILNKETKKNDLNHFEFTFIELSKFKKKENELRTIIDKWVYFLKKANKLDYIPAELNKITEINEAYDVIIQHKWSKKELDIYDYMIKKESEDLCALETAEEKGEKRGLEQGIEKGIEEGEKKKQIEIAKNLLLAQVDINIICQTTDLNIEEIEKLKN